MTNSFVNTRLRNANFQELFSNSTWMTGARLIRAASMVVQSIVIARSLGLDRYAAFAVIVAFVAPIQELCNPNLGATIIRYGTRHLELKDRKDLLALVQLSYLVAFTVVLIVVGVVGCVLFSLSYDLFFEVPGLETCLLVYAAASSLSIVDGNSYALLRLFRRFRVNAIAESFLAIMGLAVVSIICCQDSATLPMVVLTVSATIAVNSILVNIITLWELRGSLAGIGSIHWGRIRTQLRTTFRFTFGNSLAQTFERATRRCDVLLLASISPGPAVAIYDVARKIASLILLVRDPISLAVFPQVSQMIERKQTRSLRHLLWDTYRVLALPTIGFLVLIFCFGNQIAGCWGKAFVQPGWSVQWLALRALMFVIFFWNMSLLLSLGKVRVQLLISVSTTVLGFAIAFPLTTRFGADGMAFSMLLATTIAQIAYAWIGLREARILGTHGSAVPA